MVRKKLTRKKKTSRKGINKSSKYVLPILIVLCACALVFGGIKLLQSFDFLHESEGKHQSRPRICDVTEKNYGRKIDSCAQIFNLPTAYFKALVCLECSGKTGNLKRFERHVYNRLKDVRDGKTANYEGITTAMIHDCNDSGLKNLATSWGPFQIMGYKCLHLNINVSDLRGNDAVYWGIKWISEEYGHLLKNSRFKDAFHYHNTGMIFPSNGKTKTFDTSYVTNGLRYMSYF